MKIIILAAGIGSRLGNPFPKPLTRLRNGKSIMQMQVDNLTTYFSLDDIVIIVGFKKDLIMENFPDLSYIYNPSFDQTNTSKSLLRGLKKHRNSSILWLNGDVVFDPKLIDHLIPYMEKDQSLVSVNNSEVGAEEVKYTLDNNGFVNAISKEVENGMGEAIGINFIANNDLPLLLNRLEECEDMDYFEKGLELAIQKDNIRVMAVDISQFDCLEVDFEEDLQHANKLFNE
jgi:choline kinase